MRIAYIITPIEFGGSEKVNLTFLRNVNRDLFDIHPILLVRPWEKDNLFTKLVTGANYSISTIPVAIKQRNKGRDYFRVARCIIYLYGILSEGKYDLVHTHGYFADIIAAPVCKLLRIKQISTCHGFISNDNNLKIYNALDKFMLRFCNRIIAVSHGIKNDLVKSGIQELKIKVIQNAVTCLHTEIDRINQKIEKRKSLPIEMDTFVIGYVGRLSEEKGVDNLIKASSRLKNRIGEFKVIILGDGPKRSELIIEVKALGLQDNVLFLGFQNDIEGWLSALDIFVLPSLTEGTPMSLLEAMSSGLPVVASAVGGVPDVIEDGLNGYLVDPGDIHGLSERMLELSKNLELRRVLALNASNTIREKFDVEEWCRKVEKEYLDCIA